MATEIVGPVGIWSGRRLRAARQARGLTQAALATALLDALEESERRSDLPGHDGLTVSIARWEAETRTPGLRWVTLLERVLDATLRGPLHDSP